MKKKIITLIFTLFILPLSFLLSACGQTPFVPSKANYIQVFEDVTTTYNNFLTATANLSTTISDDDFVDANNDMQAKRMGQASMAMLYFMKNVCETEDFAIKDGADDCFVDDGDYIYDIKFELSYNSSDSKIMVKVLADYRDEEMLQYFIFDIFYNFETETLNSFAISGFSGMKSIKATTGVRYYKFENNNLKQLSNTAEGFTAFAENIISDMNALIELEKEESPEDYSVQYLSAMSEAMGN